MYLRREGDRNKYTLVAQQTKNPVNKQETNKKIYLIETKKNVIGEGSRMRRAL